MPRTDAHAGDSRRDPRVLLVVAGLLLAVRIALTIGEHAHAPAVSEVPPNVLMSPGPQGAPPAAPPVAPTHP